MPPGDKSPGYTLRREAAKILKLVHRDLMHQIPTFFNFRVVYRMKASCRPPSTLTICPVVLLKASVLSR